MIKKIENNATANSRNIKFVTPEMPPKILEAMSCFFYFFRADQ
jgi:hypothetical protein